ncbi:MAG: DUF805 domain-containing protein [Pseudomonadota bacterium]
MSGANTSLSWLFFSFKGRIARQSYALSILFLLLPQIVVVLQLVRNDGNEGALALWFVVLVVVVVLTFWSTLALVIKRLHDLGVTGWLSLLILLPTVNWIFILALAVIPSKDEENEYGPPPFSSD